MTRTCAVFAAMALILPAAWAGAETAQGPVDAGPSVAGARVPNGWASSWPTADNAPAPLTEWSFFAAETGPHHRSLAADAGWQDAAAGGPKSAERSLGQSERLLLVQPSGCPSAPGWEPGAADGEIDLVSSVFDEEGSAAAAAADSAPQPYWGPPAPDPYVLALRGGWWDVRQSGSKTRVGEWQGLEPAPFWDVDGLLSDGARTIDFFATGLDSETTQTGLRFFGPFFSLDFDYQRFIHRLEHDPLPGFTEVTEQQPGGDFYLKEDLNVGEDYAIRVQQLKANFKGNVTKNIQWGLNIWGMRKKGERQVNAMAHCYSAPNGTDTNGNPVGGGLFGFAGCHVLSQRQHIDWLTMEVEPVLKGTFGPTTVEYSRTMRSFSQSDQLTTRPYDRFGFAGDLPYAVVPENYTEIDRLQIGADLSRHLNLFAQLYNGNTLNRSRRTNRRFHGYDLRMTNDSIAGLTLTGYAKQYTQTGQLPEIMLPEESIDRIHEPFDYDRTTAGIKGRWRPYHDECSWRSRLLLSSGYEYRGLARPNAVYTEGTTTVDQWFTATNLFHVRGAMRWGPTLDSFVRYRLGFYDNPLFGVAKNGGTSTALPTQSHLVEIGTTWSPVDAFLISAMFGIDNSWNKSEVADFQQDSYPIVLTAWYAPTSKWSFSSGLAFYRNWIDQDITLGSLSDPVTSRWNYAGQSDVVNLGTTYAWTERLTLSGGFEFVRGSNVFASPERWPDLPAYSDVVVETTRWRAGVDYWLRKGITCYFRYQYFDFADVSEDLYSGTANMFLGGINAIY